MSRREPEELPLSPDRPLDRDVADELAFHLAQRQAELVAQGWDPAAARQEAERTFGDVQRVTDECKEITARTRRARRRADAWQAVRQDLRFAARLLRKSPGFTAAAIVTLALGIGANTAVFSVVNGVILQPLPYDGADRIVTVRETHANGWGDLAYANFLDVRDQSRSFEAMAEYASGLLTVLGADEAVRVRVAAVTADFFRVFGVQPFSGRFPAPDEHRESAAPVAVVSYGFWQTYLGARTDLAGTTLRAARTYDVVGVLPPGFDYPAATDIWIPLELESQPMSRTAHNSAAVGRLGPDASPDIARWELDGILQRLGGLFAEDFDATGAEVIRLQDQLTGSMRRPLFLLLGAAGVLLLAACTNLAGALLARGTTRQPELAVRAALGAGRERLVRQLFAEGMLLALMGAVAGVVVALVMLRVLLVLAPGTLAGVDAAGLDGWVLGFTLLVALATAVLFGLFPALRISANDPGTALREGGRTGAGPRRQRVWSLLVATEVALAVVLLAGTGLLLRSFWRTISVDPGFTAGGVLTVEINLPQLVYDTNEQAIVYYDRLLAELAAIPGVERAGVVNVLPLGGSMPNGLTEAEGKPITREDFADAVQAVYRLASRDYFAALGVRLVQGRTFDGGEGPGSRHVVVVSEAYAANAWPGETPIGKQMRPAGMDPVEEEPFATVIGVVGDVRAWSLTDEADRPTYYYSYRQRPYRIRSMTAVVRTVGSPAAVVGQVRDALRAIDPNVPVTFRTMDQRVAASLANQRFTLVVLGTFAALALVLAAVGIYGVVSYAVAQRTREIGIRLALGATPGSVRREVQGRALTAVAAGVAAGLVAAVALSRLLASLLYDVQPTDPLTIALVVAGLAVTAYVASWAPAWRGTRIDPVLAIRAD
jgi:predicted permease